MLLAVLLAAALAGQPTQDDGPLQTAPRERAASDLDEKAVEIPPAAKPADEAKTAPAAVAAARSLTVEQKTMVQGDTLQVVHGQRALFRLDDKGLPVLDRVEEGKLAAAHPEGAVEETFAAPGEGLIAVALDGSAETRATILKVWNGTDSAIDFRAIALVMIKGKVSPLQAPACAVAAGAVRTETWRRPVVAVGLSRFTRAEKARACPST